MPKTKISEFSATPGNNTDIDGINIAEGCAPSGINDAIRELMSQLKDFQAGTAGDSFNGPVGTTTAAAGAFTTLSASSSVTLSGGTANGVAYLNGSKVLTTGSALTFDGANLSTVGAIISVGSGDRVTLVNQSAGNGGLLVAANNSGAAYAPLTFDGLNQRFNVAGSEQMRLTSTGLGIGTSSPATRLEVAGDLRLTGANPSLQAVPTSSGFFIDNRGVGKPTIFRVSSASAIDTTAATIDSAGNLGLGVTPSAGGSGFYKSFELGKAGCGLFAATASLTGSELTYLAGNAVLTYSAGPLWSYGNNGNAATYGIEDGNHKWFTAPSGTAGNAISFTQAMTLDASGNLLLATTSVPAYGSKLRVQGGIETFANQFNVATTSNAQFELVNRSAAGFDFYVNSGGTLAARIDSSGNLLVGTTTNSGRLTVSGSGTTNATNNIRVANSSGTVLIQGRDDGYLLLPSTFNNTTASAANMNVDSSGFIQRSTSARKYKQDIRDLESIDIGLIKPVRYKSACANDDQTKDHFGVIADDVAQAGIEELVTRNSDGEVEGFQYERLTVVLLKSIQELKAEFDAYKATHP